MNKQPTLWFTRSNGTVRGPFTDSVIRNNALLGRLDPQKDKVSVDQRHWYLINSQDQLYTDYNSEVAVQTKLNLDERDGFDRRQSLSDTHVTPHNRTGERRRNEDEHDIERRQFRTLLMHKFRHQEEHTFWPLVTIFSLLAILFILALSYAKPFPTSQSNCELPPSSGVNWSNCLKPQVDLENVVLNGAQLRNSQLVGANLMNANLSGTDLAYADLRFANLSYSQLVDVNLLGANLKNTDLSYADLSNADLSYANLSNANLGGSNLNNVRFDHAIWIDGQVCAPSSIGECVFSNAQRP